MPTNSSPRFNNKNLSSDMSEFRWAPGMLNISIVRSSNVLIVNWNSDAYIDNVGAAVSSFLIYSLCDLPSTQALPLIFQHHFYLVKLIAHNASRFCLCVSSSGHNTLNTIM